MCFLFILFEWVTFEDLSLNNHFDSSMATPIFIAALSKAKSSRLLNDTFFDFSQRMTGKVNIIFTSVECTANDFCGKYRISRIPQFILIRSTNRKYWRLSEETDPIGWNNFLHSEINPVIYEMKSDTITDLDERLKNGGAFFPCKN
jgi:hypothetical protein